MIVLKLFSTGNAVRILQNTLRKLGFYSGSIDGIFGYRTLTAVKNFQYDFGLNVDGIVGPTSWDALLPFAYIVPTTIDYPSAVMFDNLYYLKLVYPFLDISNMGYSVLGTNIPVIKIGNGSKEVFYSASIHANEWITSVVLMRFLDDYARAFVLDTDIWGVPAKDIYNSVSIYIAPMINPDGVNLVTGAFSPGSIPYSRAQSIANNFPDIPFPSGWKANIQGVDLNLQFPAGWENAKEIKFAQGFTKPAPRDFVGSAPLVAPEAISLYNFTLAHSFSLILAYHTQGEVIYWKYDGFLPNNSLYIGEHLARASGYLLDNTPVESSFAGYKDWFIQTYNLPGYTIEAGLGENPLPISQFSQIYSDNLGILVLAAIL